MPSHYDPVKKCRVGTMDEEQFAAECAPLSRAFFDALTTAWTERGGQLRWGAGGVSLRGSVDGREIAVCFVAPRFAGKKDRIELACATLAKQMSREQHAQLEREIRAAAGERVLGTSMLSVVDPGALPAAGQGALIAAFASLI